MVPQGGLRLCLSLHGAADGLDVLCKELCTVFVLVDRCVMM